VPEGGPLELRDRAMFELAYACGLRAEELVSLRTADVDHDGEQLRVEGLTELEPDTLVGLQRYLGSGAIKGVGDYLVNNLSPDHTRVQQDIRNETDKTIAKYGELTTKIQTEAAKAPLDPLVNAMKQLGIESTSSKNKISADLTAIDTLLQNKSIPNLEDLDQAWVHVKCPSQRLTHNGVAAWTWLRHSNLDLQASAGSRQQAEAGAACRSQTLVHSQPATPEPAVGHRQRPAHSTPDRPRR